MKNSASIPRVVQAGTKQALRTQAQQILPALTAVFSDLHYSDISHQRLSQQSHDSELDYQGLTRAQHLQFGNVMIKWQLSGLSKDANQNSANLNHEADVLISINKLSNDQRNFQNSFSAIAPPILDYKNLDVERLSQLAILVIPYYPNSSLANQLSAQKHLLLTESQKHSFILQSAYLIYDLHNFGWLHNDIKPSNILLADFPISNDDSNMKADLLLTDFALAKHVYAAETFYDPAGTPAYLAPERWQGHGATMQSDIYAFGIMMTEILTGERPFNVDLYNNERLREWAILHCQYPVPILPLEYGHYQGIINKALAKRIETRYKNMKEVLRDLIIDKAYY